MTRDARLSGPQDRRTWPIARDGGRSPKFSIRGFTRPGPPEGIQSTPPSSVLHCLSHAGSVADAEDMLQDTFMRWQESSDTEIESAKAFLVTIISRLCINHLQSARVQARGVLWAVAARTLVDHAS
jgi:hypothetical protein